MNPDHLPAPGPLAYREVYARRLLQLPSDAEPELGAHLVTPWFGFAHHGIYIGNGRVIQYGALMFNLIRKPVEDVSMARFASGRAVFVVQHAECCLSAAEVVHRARSRLGERRYRLFSNNCEHFVEWCLHDVGRSFQAESALAYPRQLGERIEAAILGLVQRMLAVRAPARDVSALPRVARRESPDDRT
jgi:Lecithin retinol acyltransferase